MMTRISQLVLLALVLVLPSGCVMVDKAADAMGYETMDLDEEWKPLVVMAERPDMLGGENQITTVGNHVYVESIEKWLTKNPPGSASYRARLRHEQEHSKRQFAMGVLLWIARYGTDKSFMWAEEQLGWYYEIIGMPWRRSEEIALVLKGYKNLLGRMVSYEDALAWVNEVKAGTWEPPPIE